MEKFAIGTDVGGSHISCAAVNLEKESVMKNSIVRKRVNNQAGANEILGVWCQALETCFRKIDPNQIKGIGFAMPGPFDYEKGIALFEGVPKYHSLYGINIADRLREILSLGNEKIIRFMNDATAFAVGEAWLGKAAGFKHSLSVTLGTGFGSAFLKNGIPVVEGDHVPPMGCLWHLPYGKGIADDYFSTRWFIDRYAQKSGEQLAGVKEIAELHSIDDHISEIFDEFGKNLAGFLAPWIKKFAAEIVVIGGNIADAYGLFGSVFVSSLEDLTVKAAVGISELKEYAALIGSARLLNEEFWIRIKPLLSKM